MAGLSTHIYMRKHEKPKLDGEVTHYYCLLAALYSDVARAYPARIQTECRRDLMRIKARLSTEGLSFLTKTMPSLGKAIDTALSSDTPLRVPSFAKRRGTQLPNFLGWLLEKVFSLDGVALPPTGECCAALRHARQILMLFYKLELPYERSTVQKTVDTFKAVDKEIGENRSFDMRQRAVLKQARKLVCRVLSGSDPLKIVPRHGPGAVASGEKPWEKKHFKVLYPLLDSTYPYADHFYFNYSHLCDELGSGGLASLKLADTEPTSKVVLVPKDSRGPRLISMEPLEIQWVQQGLKDVLVNTLESHPLTRRHINFADQTVNQRLALESSKRGHLVTLDMKDASDRVSLHVVHMLFPSNWVECLEACRSTRTVCPDGDVVQYNKFAPMGSALCFPVEALVFWALSCASIMVHRHTSERQAAARVWVYGDDLVLRTEDYGAVMQDVESVGLRFNVSKCCTGAHFRESCGVDAYNGVNVTPLRVKRRWSSSLTIQPWTSWVDFSNRLELSGYHNAAYFIENEVQRLKRTPYTGDVAKGVMFVRLPVIASALNAHWGIQQRFNRRLFRMEVRTHFARSRERASCIGWRELLAHATRTLFSSQRDVESRPFRKGITLSADLIDQSLGISQPREVGWYSEPHRVSSKCGWARV